MAFISNSEIEGTNVGSRIRLNSNVRVLKGEFTRGSLLEVIGEPDDRGEFLCRDIESGETVGINPTLCSYSKES